MFYFKLNIFKVLFLWLYIIKIDWVWLSVCEYEWDWIKSVVIICIFRYFVYIMLFFFYDIGFGFAYGLLERSSYIGLFGYYLGDVDYIERVEVI